MKLLYVVFQGIWIGMICGTSLQTLILLYMIYITNWNKEVPPLISGFIIKSFTQIEVK